MTIYETKQKYTQQIMNIPGVKGIGTSGNYIVIYINKYSYELDKNIPNSLDNYQVHPLHGTRAARDGNDQGGNEPVRETG